MKTRSIVVASLLAMIPLAAAPFAQDVKPAAPAAPATITLDGMYQIADNYPPGTALDPVVLR